MNWTNDRTIFTEEYIHTSKQIYDNLFQEKGLLQGNVIDVGGGWGLFRQWWNPGESGIFVVHDPGVDRFIEGPHQLHRMFYEQAMSLPMTFVEGFGEELFYKDDSFDTCLIASTLDHCVAPQQLFAEAYRCLRPGGGILIFQDCETPQMVKKDTFLKRLNKYIFDPRRLFRAVYGKLIYGNPHLHHFTCAEIISWLEDAGFRNIEVSLITETSAVYQFQAIKVERLSDNDQ
ncbi:MAG: methyltransferase domain-containing protein [Chloroflexota bacterium]